MVSKKVRRRQGRREECKERRMDGWNGLRQEERQRHNKMRAIIL